MSPLVSGDRRLAPPFRPTAAHDSDHVTARLGRSAAGAAFPPCGCARLRSCHRSPRPERRLPPPLRPAAAHDSDHRSEEHTSELQSHSDLVCRLLLEKKKKNNTQCASRYTT